MHRKSHKLVICLLAFVVMLLPVQSMLAHQADLSLQIDNLACMDSASQSVETVQQDLNCDHCDTDQCHGAYCTSANCSIVTMISISSVCVSRHSTVPFPLLTVDHPSSIPSNLYRPPRI